MSHWHYTRVAISTENCVWLPQQPPLMLNAPFTPWSLDLFGFLVIFPEYSWSAASAVLHHAKVKLTFSYPHFVKIRRHTCSLTFFVFFQKWLLGFMVVVTTTGFSSVLCSSFNSTVFLLNPGIISTINFPKWSLPKLLSSLHNRGFPSIYYPTLAV